MVDLLIDLAPSENLLLSTPFEGSAIATLSTSTWASLGVRKDFRIEEIGGPGRAVLAVDPQIQSKMIEIEITTAFSSNGILAGSWSLFVPKTKSYVDYLPDHIEATKFLTEYFRIYQELIVDETSDTMVRLERMRSWTEMDPEFLDRTKELMGLFFDTNLVTTESKRRLLGEAKNFYERSGTDYSIKFLGYVLDAVFDPTPLWTKDYKSFVTQEFAEGEPDAELYYPTNHMNLSYDIEKFSQEEDQIRALFYEVASVPWVLDAVIGEAYGKDEEFYAAGGAVQIWEPSLYEYVDIIDEGVDVEFTTQAGTHQIWEPSTFLET